MRWILLCLLLSACAAAGPGFRGVPAVTRSLEGSRFALRLGPPYAEAIRMSPEWLPPFDRTARRAALLVQAEWPDCRVAWVRGDPAMMLMGLACADQRAPPIPRGPPQLICELVDARQQDDWLDGALHCRKV